MQNKSPRKHVIFLGAGASLTSGYPLANDLRLRLSSPRQLIFDLEKLAKDTSTSIDSNDQQICSQFFEQFKEPLELFRHGGFGTVDEFSRLAADKYAAFVQSMKRLMFLALSLHNPELMFEKSDYYPFVQRLFSPDAMPSLKHHITVISYNYDCYLDYLLVKAQTYRNRLVEMPTPDEGLRNRLTSGFFNPSDLGGLRDSTQQFRHLKLHGSIADASEKTHKELFSNDSPRHLTRFRFKIRTPPVVFPWELFNVDGKFIEENDFIFVKAANKDDSDEAPQEASVLYRLYKQIWQRAKEAVQNAHKISFVGMSMHPYLNHGLRYLFDGRAGTAEVVVANRENESFKDHGQLHPASPCGRVEEFLKEAAPKMRYVRSFSEFDGTVKFDEFMKSEEFAITPRYFFKDFIEREMD